MGGSPGSSARCIQCRRRRRKCDLGRPCSGCLKAGTDCSGPTETRIYVHINARVIHARSHRNNLQAAFATRAELAIQNQETRNMKESHEASKAIFTPSISVEKSDCPLNIVSIRMLYASLAEEFKPTLEVGIFSGDRIRQGISIYSSLATGIRGLLPYALHSNRILDLSLFTLLTRYFGAFRTDENLINLARSSYTMVLSEFQKHIYSMEHMLQSDVHSGHTSRALICLCLALLLFETIDQSASNDACEVHLDGVLKVLQITGPTVYEGNESLQRSFKGLRGLVIPIALRRRRRTFLADESWLNLPFTIIGKPVAIKMHDIALRLPALMERTDKIISSHDTDPLVVSKAIEVKMEYLSVRESFIDWLKHIISDEHGPIYWFTSDQPYIKSDPDPICIPHLSEGNHKVSFRDGPKAGLLAHYWGFRLELVMGLLDLYKIEDRHYVQMLDSVPGLDVSRCLSEANNLAQLILETVPYLSSCLEGRISMQGPLESLGRYHERMNLN